MLKRILTIVFCITIIGALSGCDKEKPLDTDETNTQNDTDATQDINDIIQDIPQQINLNLPLKAVETTAFITYFDCFYVESDGTLLYGDIRTDAFEIFDTSVRSIYVDSATHSNLSMILRAYIKEDNSLWSINWRVQYSDEASGDIYTFVDASKILDDVALVIPDWTSRYTFAIKTDKTLWVWERDTLEKNPIFVTDDVVDYTGNSSFILKSDGLVYMVNIEVTNEGSLSPTVTLYEDIKSEVISSLPDVHTSMCKTYYYNGRGNMCLWIDSDGYLWRNLLVKETEQQSTNDWKDYSLTTKRLYDLSDVIDFGIFNWEAKQAIYFITSTSSLWGCYFDEDEPFYIADNIAYVYGNSYITRDNELWVWNNILYDDFGNIIPDADFTPEKYFDNIYCYGEFSGTVTMGARFMGLPLMIDGRLIDGYGDVICEDVRLPQTHIFP